MDHTLSKQQDHESSAANEQQKIAVPYIPPPPPDASSQKKFRSPLINGILIALVILIGGFMTYNFVGHSLTQISGATIEKSSVSPSVSPSMSPTPTPQY